MARSRKRGERVLESRHLVGLFLGVVLLCSVFFTLGYVMGRTQYDMAVHAADSSARVVPRPAIPAPAKAKEPPASPSSGEWDFYANKSDDHLQPSPPAPKASSASAASPASVPVAEQPAVERSGKRDRRPAEPARFVPPRMFGKTIVLQVAAVTHQSDALAVADALQRKRFPSFVVAPSSDNFYRVQVGPYPDERAADSARNALSRAGFKAIVKR
jgi:DedD protein